MIIRVFPRRTHWTPDDELAFVGDLPLPGFRPCTPETPVMVSCTFTWDRKRAEEIVASWGTYYRNVQIGGPAYKSPAVQFTPGQFLKKGCTITTRGCPKSCGWCIVPELEGPVRLLPIHEGWIVQDNNLLASCKKSLFHTEAQGTSHFVSVFDMLASQNRSIYFNGGLDKHFLEPWHVGFFDRIPIGELWWACDRSADLKALYRVKELFSHVPLRKMRCYTMIGYDHETPAEAERRIEKVFELGFMPFSQLYQPPDAKEPVKVYSDDWKKVNKKWCRPAAYMCAAPMARFDLPLFAESKEAGL